MISAFADPQFDPNAPPVVKPLPIPATPDRQKMSYAIGMNLGLQRKQANSDADIDAFAKGMNDMFQNKPTEIPFADTMQAINVMRAHGANATAAEKKRFAYAMGVRWGSTLKDTAPDCDTSVIIAAIKDVAEGRPLKLQESEMQPLLDSGRQYGLYLKGAKNRQEGTAFLAARAKEPGVHKVSDGLYYRVIKEGTGPDCVSIKTNEVFFVKWKGSSIDGREFDHHNRFPKSLNGGWPAWSLVMRHMKVGEQCEIYSAPEYSLGREGDQTHNVGPDSTVVWNLEVREIVKENDPRLGSGRLGHGIAGKDD
jgi:FKBP-type peptidyl-prolyl cis-trans isomerase FkpA